MVTESSLDSPDAVFRDIVLEAKPLGARGTVALPIEAGVIGKDLDAGADDEHHEEQIEKMQQSQPQREARVNAREDEVTPG